ncbi:hypothetical protein [Methanobrevibacter gottschalkii]|uniref:hypothetical protein n=1 Tax=Methanobrevibacter gottschalkii TaxID=190974 RepID=UPI0026EDD6BE|nr:hypothetical protein [Methanobrevibacter gottschalkii]
MKYLSRIEWEFLQDEKEISFIEETNLNLFEVTKIYLKRNEKYEILLDITGKVNQHDSEEIKKLNQPVDIHFKTKFHTYDLFSCHIIKNNMTFPQNEYNVVFKVQNVERFINKYSDNEEYFIKEWYLNSTQDSLIFKRGTSFNIKKEFIKIRDISKNSELNILDESMPDSSLDSLFLELNDYSILLQEVPQKFGPDWSKNLGVEYQKELNIPPKDIREKIVEIISFLMGRFLIKIGETHYDKDWNIINDSCQSPLIPIQIDLKQICKKSDLSCIDFYEGFPLLNIVEERICYIVNNYLNEDEMDLSYVIHQLLLSMIVPVEAEIVMIGACLDKLSEIWFKSSKSKSKGELIEKKKFDELIEEYVDGLKISFKDYPKVFVKIENAFQASGKQRVDFFLEELELETGDVEKDARFYRNKPAHGHLLDNEGLFKLMYLTDAYRTLLNRIILKILNYDVYIDLTSGNILSIDEKLSEENYENYVKMIKEHLNNDST